MKSLNIFALLILLLCSNIFAAGELDPSLNTSVYDVADTLAYVVEKQPDGKILVGGYYSAANTTATPGLVRLNADGSIDPTLSYQNLFNSLGTGASVTAIAVQADGKIVVGGRLLSPVGLPQYSVRRLNPDGALDPTFMTHDFGNSAGTTIYDLELQADGKILVAGVVTGPGNPEGLFRLNPDGSIDSSFAGQTNSVIRDVEVRADGSLMIVGYLTLDNSTGIVRRLTTTGAVDSSFAEPMVNSQVYAVKIRPNGQILVGGKFTNVNGFNLGRLALFNTDGSLDLTFNQNNPGASGGLGEVHDIEIDANGKIMIGGRFTMYNGVSRKSLARLNSDGTLDTSFSDNPLYTGQTLVPDLEILPGSRVMAVSQFNPQQVTVAVFNADGSVDSSFNVVLSNGGQVRRIVYLANGKIMIAGNFSFVNGVRQLHLARLNWDGTLDTSFVPYFNLLASARPITALAVQADGKVVIGMETNAQTLRLNADGSLDTGFNSPFFGTPDEVAVLPNGQVLVGGTFMMRRLNSNGTNDSSFNAAVAGVKKIHVLGDGKMFIGGTFTTVGVVGRGRIAKLNSDGSLDASFNPPGGANGTVEDLDIQADGKIIVGGDFTSLNGATRLRIGRFLSDGNVDGSFVQSIDNTVRAVKLQADGKVLVGGSFGFVQSESHVGLVRLNSNGSVDASFIARPNTSVLDIALQLDNKILIGGDFIRVNDTSALRFARLLNTSVPTRTPFDYDGDAKADVSVFRSSENKWYILRSSDSTIDQPIFGTAGDIPVPADYDGDRKTDVAIFRPSTGTWWYRSSINGSQIANPFGQSGDIPRPSDFDGDGKDDFVLFRPSNNTWYRFGSTAGSVPNFLFGAAGDQPLVGDFDGDGKADPAIFRPSTGDWWYAASSAANAFRQTHWGQNGDLPDPADFDGDGKTDNAIFRPSDGGWYIYNSSNGSFTIMQFGTNGDRPVAADYDGDGRADVAVFRPSTGIWYLFRSTAGFAGLQFGISTDTPTPSAYVP